MKLTRKLFLQMVALLCVLCLTGTAWADVLVIPSGNQVIEEEAFAGTHAETVVIQSSTETIESKAFASCDYLKDVYLPEKPVSIAEDAFGAPDRITFHVYMGSANANWALDHGYHVAYMTADDLDAGGWNKVASLVQTEATSTSSNELYYTHRLIVCLQSGSEMPDVSNFKQAGEEDPIVVPLEENYYVIQFNNPTSARNCAIALNAWEGCRYAEADYFISEAGGLRSRSRSINTDDPMGFGVYTDYLVGKNVGNVTVAVIDTGVNSDQVNCNVSAKSYDLVNSRMASGGFEDGHGTNVANEICSAFGNLVNHLSIISYRVVDPSNSRASYLLVGKAIRRAKDDGASFANISHVFESTYINDQNNMFLQECISYFGSSRVFAAAGNNAVMSAQNVLPAKYCQSVTGAQLGSDGETLVRAPGTATGANYAGFSTTTSYATAKVVAAAALCFLDPDPTHTLNNACKFVTSDCGYGMPDLSQYPYTPVSQIVLNNGDPIESVLEIGDRASIDYEVIPDDATISTVTVTSSDSNVVEVLSNTGVRVRIHAKGKGTANLVFSADDGNVDPIIVLITVVKPVTSITVTGDTGETLMKGETLPLNAIVLPEDATDTSVTWTSSNDTIATVSETGVVTQVGAGEVTITAISNYDSSISASVSLVVSDIPDVTGVTVTAPKSTIGIGQNAETLQMTAVVSPEEADQTVTWNVDRPEVATISETGLLTAKRAGEVIVTATSVSSGKSGYMGITVVQLPTSVSISGSETVNIDETMQLTAVVAPDNAIDKSVIWTSSKTSVATVDTDSGLVTGISEGTAVIIAKCNADNSIMDYYVINVTVLPDFITINTPSSTTLDIDETLALSATVSPSNTSNKTVTWSTNDSTIATVSPLGVVTAKTPGSVQITASTVNRKTDSITLTVRQPYTLSFNANGGTCGTSSWTCYSGYAIGGTLPIPTRDYYTFNGWYTAESGGVQVTASTTFTSTGTVTIYAHWTMNPLSPWVLESQVPANATIEETSWSYRETAESTATSIDGWISNGSYWSQTGTGSANYATFPSGFDTGHTLYTTYLHEPYSANETTTTKREVMTTPNVGYIYWHWMYSRTYDTTQGVSISSQRGQYTYQNSSGETSSKTNYYYFFAFASTVDCPSFGTTSAYIRPKTGTRVETWDCNSIINSVSTSAQRNSSTSGVGCRRFLRFAYGVTSYNDYQKIFRYYRDINNSSSDPGNGTNIINKVKYVKYREK